MDPQEPHADLISATQTLITISMVQVELEHVKGHQDNKLLRPLTRDATLNVEADHMARTKLLEHTNGPNQFHIPWSQGVCYTGTQ